MVPFPITGCHTKICHSVTYCQTNLARAAHSSLWQVQGSGIYKVKTHQKAFLANMVWRFVQSPDACWVGWEICLKKRIPINPLCRPFFQNLQDSAFRERHVCFCVHAVENWFWKLSSFLPTRLVRNLFLNDHWKFSPFLCFSMRKSGCTKLGFY